MTDSRQIYFPDVRLCFLTFGGTIKRNCGSNTGLLKSGGSPGTKVNLDDPRHLGVRCQRANERSPRQFGCLFNTRYLIACPHLVHAPCHRPLCDRPPIISESRALRRVRLSSTAWKWKKEKVETEEKGEDKELVSLHLLYGPYKMRCNYNAGNYLLSRVRMTSEAVNQM